MTPRERRLREEVAYAVGLLRATAESEPQVIQPGGVRTIPVPLKTFDAVVGALEGWVGPLPGSAS